MLDWKVPRVDYEKLSSDRLGKSSAAIREHAQAAREQQRVRFEGPDIWRRRCNIAVKGAGMGEVNLD